MKKLLTASFMLALSLLMVITPLALPSPVNNGSIINQIQGVDANNNPITPIIEENVEPAIGAQATSPETLKAVLGDDYKEGMTVLSVVDVKVPEGTAFPVKITLYITGVTSDTQGAVLHYNSNTGVWEKVTECEFHDGYVVATFNSLSPVAVVIDEKTATAIDKIFNANSNNLPSSPQTSDITSIAILIMASSVVTAGAIITRRKK
jgi:hypothetical protein